MVLKNGDKSLTDGVFCVSFQYPKSMTPLED